MTLEVTFFSGVWTAHVWQDGCDVTVGTCPCPHRETEGRTEHMLWQSHHKFERTARKEGEKFMRRTACTCTRRARDERYPLGGK